MTPHAVRAPVRTVELEAIAAEAAEGPPWTFSGIAVGAGDILHTDDGTRVLFTAEALQEAADTQADEPLTADHPEDDEGRPQYPPSTDETIGRVEKAGWVASAQGVGYEATTHDEGIARGIQSGSYDVSVHPMFELGDRDPETGALVAENVRFRDLSVVSKGDSPSNTAEWGPNEALASLTASVDVRAELTASAGQKPLTEMTVDEFADVLAEEIGLLTEDEFVDRFVGEQTDGEAEATGGLSAEEAERLEAYGTGVEPPEDESLGAGFELSPQAQQLQAEALQKARSRTDPDEFGTGVQASALDESSGGQADQRWQEVRAVAEECETMGQFALAIGESVARARKLASRYDVEASLADNPEAYGTGVEGAE